jgi:HPt (histidine-containing phosphotransfer) domain-containing protein
MTVQPRGTSQVAMNPRDFLARVDNDRELACELITIFKEDYPNLLRMLKESVLSQEMKLVETIGHTLTGMLSCLSAAPAAARAAQLEKMGRVGQREGLAEALALFESEIAVLLPELEEFVTESKL